MSYNANSMGVWGNNSPTKRRADYCRASRASRYQMKPMHIARNGVNAELTVAAHLEYAVILLKVV